MSPAIRDTLERTARTIVQAAAAAWIVDASFTLDGLKVAGVAAFLALVMALAGTKIGDRRTASYLDSSAGPTDDDLVPE